MEAKVLSIIETKVTALVKWQLTATVESKCTAVVEWTLEAPVVAKLEPITAESCDTFTMLSRRIDTHTAKINYLKSQLTNFMAHVKNNYISHVKLEDCHGRKNHVHREKTFLTQFLPKASR